MLLAGCSRTDPGPAPAAGIAPTDLVSLSVTPVAPSIALGKALQMAALATFADGSSRNVSATATWATSAPAVATVSETGNAASVTAGNALISATYSVKTASVTLTVTPAELVSIALSPATASIAAGADQQYSVMGSYSDAGRRDVTGSSAFVSSNLAVATIGTSTGLAKGLAEGNSLITATNGTLTASNSLTVMKPEKQMNK
jgi:hypothetical protein